MPTVHHAGCAARAAETKARLSDVEGQCAEKQSKLYQQVMMPFAPTPVLHARMQLPCMFSLPADTHPRSHAYTHGLSSCVVCLWWAQVLPKVVQHLHKQEAKRAAFQLGVLERLQSLTQRHRDADLEGNRALGAPRMVRIRGQCSGRLGASIQWPIQWPSWWRGHICSPSAPSSG